MSVRDWRRKEATAHEYVDWLHERLAKLPPNTEEYAQVQKSLRKAQDEHEQAWDEAHRFDHEDEW